MIYAIFFVAGAIVGIWLYYVISLVYREIRSKIDSAVGKVEDQP